MIFSSHAHGAPAHIARHLSNPQEVGSGRLTFLFWDAYDITLHAPEGTWDPDSPYALTLDYLVEIEGADIAERSVEEMQGQGITDRETLNRWHADMKRIFPDVGPGISLTGIYLPAQGTRFYKNGEPIGTVTDPDFGPAFFNIWLSEKTSEPKLRKQLLGL